MPPRHRIFIRSQAIQRARRKLEAESYPRLQMTLIAALTGAFGLLSSFVMLRQGVESMALRYPLAVGLAYAMFLFLVWLWLRTNREDYADVPDLSPSSGSGSGGSGEVGMPIRSGGRGDFGGGGASAQFDRAGSPVADSPGLSSDLGDAAGAIAEADELAIPLLAVVLAVGLAVASLYIIYIAPALLAELLVDGALSYALYRYVRGDDPEHWLVTAVRRTALPFVFTAIFVAVAGAGMSAYAPGARSIGEVVRVASSSK
ncbi:hypothetical protein [Hydrogenophaga sp.]|uniref:hypothetical protein n=1 Tax=Hydrogenophaga sp. TaxID=1904254 RepID=UPI00356B00BA